MPPFSASLPQQTLTFTHQWPKVGFSCSSLKSYSRRSFGVNAESWASEVSFSPHSVIDSFAFASLKQYIFAYVDRSLPRGRQIALLLLLQTLWEQEAVESSEKGFREVNKALCLPQLLPITSCIPHCPWDLCSLFCPSLKLSHCALCEWAWDWMLSSLCLGSYLKLTCQPTLGLRIQ